MSDSDLQRQARIAMALERVLDKLERSNEHVEKISSVVDAALMVRLMSSISDMRQEVGTSLTHVYTKLDGRIERLDTDLSRRIDELESMARRASRVAEVAHEAAEAAHETAEAAVEEATGRHDLSPKPEDKPDRILSGASAATSILDKADKISTRTWVFILLLVAVLTTGVVFYALEHAAQAK